MADLLDIYKPEFWAQETLLQLFPRLVMTNMVHRDFEQVIANQGDIVNTRIPDKFLATDVNPGAYDSQTPKARNVQVVMNKWKHVAFTIGDKEQSLLMKRVYDEFLPNAAQAIAQDIEGSLMGLYADVYNNIGTPGTALDTVDKIGTDVRQKFNDLWTPAPRNVALSSKAENFFNRVFYQAYVSGDAQQQNTGDLRQKFGQTYFYADLLPSHVAGTPAGVSGAGVKLASDVAYDAAIDAAMKPTTQDAGNGKWQQLFAVVGLGASAIVKKGDIVLINGDPHVCTAETQADGTGNASLPLCPPVPNPAGPCPAPGEFGANGNAAWVAGKYAANAPVVILASHQNCLGFNEGAFALVTRPLNAPGYPGAAVSVMNYNGISIRASVWYAPKEKTSYVDLDILYGVKTLDPRKAFRLVY
jgi:hypothetical protein